MDYTKGIPHRLRAFERFLERYPSQRGRVEMVQVGVPTRLEVPEYQALRDEVEGLVGHINGRFGSQT
ncbi:trehalose-6-phosphate synthase, partial [Arthrospira platensis SPKY1]|nr:trehalose-6-phosphate synthase [Arthrospira platensis SPKY1]